VAVLLFTETDSLYLCTAALHIHPEDAIFSETHLEQDKTMNQVFKYFSYAMIAIFVIAGIGVVIFPPEILQSPSWARFVAGAILILYAVFRFERIRYMNNAKRRNKNEQ
jgi:FtsH-binding integral membrane protein